MKGILLLHAIITFIVLESFSQSPWPPLSRPNVLSIFVAPNDSIYVYDTFLLFHDLKQRVVSHIMDTSGSSTSPEVEVKQIQSLGKRKVSRQVISFTNHLSTSYKTYVKVQDEIVSAYMMARDSIGLKEFDIRYSKMLDNRKEFETEIKIIRTLLPTRISENAPLDD